MRHSASSNPTHPLGDRDLASPREGLGCLSVLSVSSVVIPSSLLGLDFHYLAYLINPIGRQPKEVRGILRVFAEENKQVFPP
jgi:hypothetical protein